MVRLSLGFRHSCAALHRPAQRSPAHNPVQCSAVQRCPALCSAVVTWHIPLRCSGDRPPYFLYLIRTIIRIIRTVPTLWEIFHSHRSYVEAIGYHISRNALLQCLRVRMRFKGELHVTVVEAQVCFSVGSCLLSCLVYFQWSAHGPRLVARARTHTHKHT